MKRRLALALSFLLLAWGLAHFHGMPSAASWDRLPGDRGDGRFIPFSLEHEYLSLLGHGDFASPPFFYPAKGTLGYSDVLLGMLPFYSSFRLLGTQPFDAMQGTLWALDLLGFLFALGFLRRGLGWNFIPSVLGAAFYAFNHARYEELNHYQMQAGYLLPAAGWLLAAWWRDWKTAEDRWDLRPAAACLLLDIQLLTSYYLGWFSLCWLFLFLVSALFSPRGRSDLSELIGAQSRALTAALISFLLGLLPFLFLYGPVAAASPARRYEDYLSLMPVPGAWFWMGPDHPLWGGRGRFLGLENGLSLESEMRMGWGILVISFLAVSLVFLTRRNFSKNPNQPKTSYLFSALLMATLALGFSATCWSDLNLGRWVFAFVPGAQAVRSVGRLAVFLAFPVSVWLAWAAQAAGNWMDLRESKQRRLFQMGAGLLAALALAEQYSPPPGAGYSARAEWARLSRMAQGIPKSCEVFYLTLPPGTPGSSAEWSLDAAWAALLSGVPTLNGYSGTEPPGYELRGLKRPEYPAQVQDWIARNHLKGPVCEIVIQPERR